MQDPVVKAAQSALRARLEGSPNISDCTKYAQAIAKAWRRAVHDLDPHRFQIEAMVVPELDQKIDVVDLEKACAYEFKVSGKNATAEFYKDVVKVILWNQEPSKDKLSSLVFITEEKYGQRLLDAPMPRVYIKYLAQQGLKVNVEYVRHPQAQGELVAKPAAGIGPDRPAKGHGLILARKPDLRPGGQAALVYEALVGLGKEKESVTRKDVVEAVAATGRLVSRQPVERVVGYYLAQFKAKGWLKEA